MAVTQRSVLIVDDDKSIRRMLSKWLAMADYDVTEAENGEQALELIKANCPDFLITDWNMPIMDGVELCSRVRSAELPHYIYTILFTGRSSGSDLVAALEAGADDFTSKPVNREEFLARLHAGAPSA